MREIALTVNGKPVTALAEPRTHLADFLREGQNLTGTHLGCEHGVCGACTVLADGVPIRSCITLAIACHGAEIVTIEGFEDDAVMGKLRTAFQREHALQCGYCTPGMLISARDFVLRTADSDESEIRTAMSGNLCRCTGYVGIVRAIASVLGDGCAAAKQPAGVAREVTLGPAGSGRLLVEANRAAPARSTASSEKREDFSQSSASLIEAGWVPQVSFDQNFIVRYPRQEVWETFGRIEEVASCLPGASLIGEPRPDRARGRIRVKVGPIGANFQGEAQIERDAGSYSGRIVGAGRDAASGSKTRGSIAYRLLPADGGSKTEVAMTVGYTLTGLLAQFGRSGIVKDVAGKLSAAFVSNLERKLSGEDLDPELRAAGGLNALSLVFAILRQKFIDFLRSLSGRR
jgi:aerobic carbon-monoxide dehydrogenase small subunit